MGEIAKEHGLESRPLPLNWVREPKRPSRSGLPFGRVPQSNRSMDKPTFVSLGRLLGFMAEQMGAVLWPGCATRTSFSGHPSVGVKAGHALTFKSDHL